MSADLFAAFGQPQSLQKAASKSSPEEDSTWSAPVNTHTEPEHDETWILQSRPIHEPPKQKQQGSLWKQDSRGADVLFDASDDDQNEDDFGDFQDVISDIETKKATDSSSLQQQSHNANTDLLGLDDFSTMQIAQPKDPPVSGNLNTAIDDLIGQWPVAEHLTIQHQTHPTGLEDIWTQSTLQTGSDPHGKHKETTLPEVSTSTDDDWGNFEDAETETTLKLGMANSTYPTVIGSKKDDPDLKEEDWDTFEEDTTIVPTQKSLNHTDTNKLHQKRPQPQTQSTIAATSTTTPQPSALQARPTNIPPPSTLLQLLPKIYHTLSQQSRLPNSPPQLATHILQIYISTARIISGRGHRWKRDTLLSQSMRISQAGLKSTGMKLTALDKSETIKEDQEAQEAISAWQRHAAVLNATMLKAKVPKPPMSLSQTMAVRTASGPGVMTAKECCAVCGLKRNERVTGIDVRVEDTFGEFWVEYWGHKDCYEFWYAYEGLLSKR